MYNVDNDNRGVVWLKCLESFLLFSHSPSARACARNTYRGRVPSRITLSALSRLIEPSSSFVRLRVKIPRCRCDHEM